MHYLTTKITFSAYHRLWNPDFTDVQNSEIYQECFRGHGHNYVLEVTVKGKADLQTGMVIDIKRLNRLLMTEIFPLVDHKNLNEDIACLKHVIPTAENISMQFWRILKNKLKDADLHKIRLLESEKNIVEYFGE